MGATRLFDEGYLQELECDSNYALILNDEDSLLITEYKIMKGQAGGVLCPCTKVTFNGKTELYYLTAGLKSFESICRSLNPVEFEKVVEYAFETLSNIRNNGFLHLNKADFSSHRIMVDPATYKVKVVYIPVKKSVYLDDDAAESELKKTIIKCAANAENLAGDRIDKLTSILSNEALSTGDICAKLRVPSMGADSQEHKSDHIRSKIKLAKLISSSLEKHMEISITKSGFIIGKNASMADAQVVSPTLSRMHCRIDLEDGIYYITDLNSTNGTYINGKRVSPNALYPIENGDTITLANIDFVMQIEEGENA